MEDNHSHINYQNQVRHPRLSHIEQEYEESLIQGKIHIQRRPRILVRLSFSCGSKISGLRALKKDISLS